MMSNPNRDEPDNGIVDPVEVMRAAYYIGSEADALSPHDGVIAEFLPTLLQAARNGAYSYCLDLHVDFHRVTIQVVINSEFIDEDV